MGDADLSQDDGGLAMRDPIIFNSANAEPMLQDFGLFPLHDRGKTPATILHHSSTVVKLNLPTMVRVQIEPAPHGTMKTPELFRSTDLCNVPKGIGHDGMGPG
ncbi:hypothetical protein FQA39_LY05534 [Lamprigera yunnana]|nr:hypothetical protein FQA39_LY05534 [Lamprigera yunnana]